MGKIKYPQGVLAPDALAISGGRTAREYGSRTAWAVTRQARKLLVEQKTRNPFEIAESLGVHILYVDSLNRLKGLYRVIARNRFIILNRNNSPQLQKIVCAHELGHDQLHRAYATGNLIREFKLYDVSSRQEYEANLFAAELLLDDEEMTEHIKNGYDAWQIAGLMHSDPNLVALKLDGMICRGMPFRAQPHNTRFLK